MTRRAAGGDPTMSPEDNRQMFDRIARRYDRMNRLMSLGLDRRWRRSAVKMLDPQPGRRYLDVGCGTGDMAIEILRRCPDATIVGIDPAEQMLAIAAERLQATGLSDSVELRTGSADALDFPDASFAGVVSAFCVRNLADRPRALREMRRILSPGGSVAILELTVPPCRLLRLGHRIYTARLVPLAARLITRDPAAYRYLADSVRAFPAPADFLATLADAGFVAARHCPLHAGVVSIFTSQAP